VSSWFELSKKNKHKQGHKNLRAESEAPIILLLSANSTKMHKTCWAWLRSI